MIYKCILRIAYERGQRKYDKIYDWYKCKDCIGYKENCSAYEIEIVYPEKKHKKVSQLLSNEKELEGLLTGEERKKIFK